MTKRQGWRRRILAGLSAALMTASAMTGTPLASAQVCSGEIHGFCVSGPTLAEYRDAATYNGYADGPAYFGNATNAIQPAADGGTWQAFQQHGYILNHPTRTGGHANQIWGEIHQKWAAQNNESGPLGYPRTRELNTQTGGVYGQIGRFNEFEHGWIYWSDRTGGHTLEPTIFGQYANRGWEHGTLGFPTSDTLRNCTDNVSAQAFEGGYLTSSAAHSFERSNNVASVNGVPTLQLISQTRYGSSVDHAVNAWNGVSKRVQVQKVTGAFTPGIAPVRVVDSPRADVISSSGYIVYGYYSGPTADPVTSSGGSVIELYYNNIQSQGQDPNNVVTHEIGHALGIGHTCYSQLMAPSASISDPTTPQALDIAILNSKWK